MPNVKGRVIEVPVEPNAPLNRSAALAIALAPLHRVLARACGNRPKTAAALLVLVLLGLVIFPLSFLPASFEGGGRRDRESDKQLDGIETAATAVLGK